MRNSKRIKIVAGGTAILMGGGIAFAYWTTTGSGDGSATNALENGTVTLYASFDDGLAPGQSRTVTYTGDNDSDTDLRVGTITPTVSTSDVGCLASWFTIAPTTSDTTVPGNNPSPVALGTGTLTFTNDAAVNQDDCKNAEITLTLASN
jgi:hypothetical protein